jgi:hypothetical protein
LARKPIRLPLHRPFNFDGLESSLATSAVIVHERLGTWIRQLRPRLLSWPIRWLETRSSSDLQTALTGLSCPIVVIDVASRLRTALEDLDLTIQTAPNAMVLVLYPGAHKGVSILARELGATHVIHGTAPPPDVARLLARWLPLADHRTENDGWSRVARRRNEPEPWNWLTPLLADDPGSAQDSRP